jgi:hypothetical protein
MPIKKHTSIEGTTSQGQVNIQKPRCDDLRYKTSYNLILPDKSFAIASISDDAKGNLRFNLSISGKPGLKVKFENRNLKYRYLGKDWQSLAGGLKLSEYKLNWVNDKIASSPEFSGEQDVSFSNVFVFPLSDKKTVHDFFYFADLPKESSDLEIEIPAFYLDSNKMGPAIILFKWTDSWRIAPLNGC